MRQKSLNENMKAREQSKGEMTTNIEDIDDLLDDEGWDLLNSLTEEEIAQLNSDFDPENTLIPTGERVNHERHIPGTKTIEVKEVKPQFSQKDLVKTMDSMLTRHQGERPVALAVNSTLPPAENKEGEKTMYNQKDLVKRLDEMVAKSKPVIKNEKIRQKEEERQKQKQVDMSKKFDRTPSKLETAATKIILTEEEEELLADATEEELIEAAALLNMNDILTADQINAVFAGDKPTGGMSSNVKGTLPKQALIANTDVETDLDVVELNRHLKADTDDLFFVCVNNQPKLEKQTLDLLISSVGTSKTMKHLSLSMIGLADKQCIALAQAISCNKQLETLNLDSNVIGMPGIEALMSVVGEHPSLREIKVSNQKQPFGGQGEECMASAIVKNQNILKFGYSFKQAAPRNKADRAIIRNNEIMRQKRRNGEETYDLKSVCKIRDPWPQPWIKIKGQRLLGSQLESKVTDMGLMIDVDADTRRESRGPKVREEREAKPLDIAALLAARASKLKGTKVADLDKEAEERRKKTLLAMKQSEEESGKIGTMLKKGTTPIDKQQPKPKEETLNLGNKETTPPVEEDDKKKNLRGKGADITSLEDEGPLKRKAKAKDDKEEIEIEKEEKKKDVKPKPSSPEPSKHEKKDWGKSGVKIAQLNEDEPKVPVRRKKKTDDEEPQGLDFNSFKSGTSKKEEKVKEPSSPEPSKHEKKDRGKSGVKIAELNEDEPKVPVRRKKKTDDEEPQGLDFSSFKSGTSKKEEKVKPVEQVNEKPKPIPEPAKLSPEENKKKLSLEGGAKIVARFDEEEVTPRRRRKKRFEEEEDTDPFKELEKRKTTEQEKRETEKIAEREEEEEKVQEDEEKNTKLSDHSLSKANLPVDGGKKIAPLAPVEDALPVRRRKAKDFDTDPEPDFLKTTKEEPKKEESSGKLFNDEETNSGDQILAEKPLSAAEERAKALKERREALAAKKAGSSPKPDTETATSDKPLSAAEQRAKALRERREALAAKKANTASQPSSDAPLSPAEERAEALRERREALAAKRNGASTTSTSPASDKPLSTAEEGAGRLKEGREELAQRKLSSSKPTTETTTSNKPIVDVASSLGSSSEDSKTLSLKERRALLAEKKRQMGK